MTPTPIGRPDPTEYDDYYHRYISLVPEQDLVEFMQEQMTTFPRFMASTALDKGDHAYAPGKWTVKEVLGHLIDTERVFMHRAVSIARSDPSPLPGFDQNVWCARGEFTNRTLEDLVDEWSIVRRASIVTLRGLPDGASTRVGSVNGLPASARALAYLPAGHVVYHIRILRDSYGLA